MTFTLNFKTPEEYAKDCKLRGGCEKKDCPIPSFCKNNCAHYRRYLTDKVTDAVHTHHLEEKKDG